MLQRSLSPAVQTRCSVERKIPLVHLLTRHGDLGMSMLAFPAGHPMKLARQDIPAAQCEDACECAVGHVSKGLHPHNLTWLTDADHTCLW